MKRWHILTIILVMQMIQMPLYGQYDDYCPCDRERIPVYYNTAHEYRNGDDSEYTSSLVGAILLGMASGFLCRQFEKIVLLDFLILRVPNLIIWGYFQGKIMDNVTIDLHNQKIKHSPDMMKKAAWLASWISYLLGD